VSQGAGQLAVRSGLPSWFDDDDPKNRHAAFLRRFLTGTIIVSTFGIVLGTVAELDAAYGPWFRWLEGAAIAIFTLEYPLRLWCAPRQASFAGRSPAEARLDFVLSAPGLIDLLTILPAFVGVVLGGKLRILLLLRLLRFFKLARYSPGMRSLALVLQAERKALLASAVILLGFVLVAAAAIYAAEADAQPDKLGSIPAAMWWAIVTLTTVGYGDVYPVTVPGRMVASITMVFGLMMLALPVGIVATAFAEEIHRREFVVTWGMIARIPLFSTLSAAEIGDITRFLHARAIPPGAPVVLKGDRARSMFVIASGEVEVDLPGGAVRLGEGQFFGERAMFENALRNATVRAIQPTRLLVLEKEDLHRLMARNPELRDRIRKVALARQEATEGQAGD
jgi:voltage-gated potassium channel